MEAGIANAQKSPTLFWALATADQTLGVSVSDVPGCQITLPHTGHYLITGVFDFWVIGAGDAAQNLIGELVNVGSGAIEASQALFAGDDNNRGTVSNVWPVLNVTGSTSYKLRVRKAGGTGTSRVMTSHTKIAAQWSPN